MHGEVLCFSTRAFRVLLATSRKIQRRPAPANEQAGDARRVRKTIIHEVVSAAKDYLAEEEFRLNSLIEQLPGAARRRATCLWSKADEELDPIRHRRLVMGLTKSLSADDAVKRGLQGVISGKISLEDALAHDLLPIALQFGANYADISPLKGQAFKNWMRDRPAELCKAADAALKSGWFQRERGKRRKDHIDRYVRRIDKIYTAWTGQKLSTSSTVRSKTTAADLGEDIPGASLAFLMACLEPLFPGMTPTAASHHLRNARKIKD